MWDLPNVSLKQSALPCFNPIVNTKQLFMWPSMTLWGWHYIMDFVDVLVRGQPLMMPLMMLLMIIMMHQPHPYQPWRLNRCNAFTQSFICAAIFISPGGWMDVL